MSTKRFANTLGFDTIQTTESNNILEFINSTGQPTFSGYTTSLSSKEVDAELWRRLVINAWYLFKSKGTRKGIEFFIKLLNIPESLIEFNEHIYLVQDKLDYETIVQQIEEETGQPFTDITVPMDSEGYPQVPRNTSDFYYQSKGGWYKESSGLGTTENITKGNNPHIGPYDYGSEFVDRFDCFVGKDEIIPTTTTINTSVNIFEEFGQGTMEINLPTYSSTYGENITRRSTLDNALKVTAGRSSSNRNSGSNSLRVSFELQPINTTSSANKTDCVGPS